MNIEHAYNEEWAKYDDDNDPRVKEIFINKVTSPVVEKFLADKNSDVKYIPLL